MKGDFYEIMREDWEKEKELLREIVLDSGEDDELGEAEHFGWYGLIKGLDYNAKKKELFESPGHSYIVHIGSAGGFDIVFDGNTKRALYLWEKLQEEYEEYLEQVEE